RSQTPSPRIISPHASNLRNLHCISGSFSPKYYHLPVKFCPTQTKRGSHLMTATFLRRSPLMTMFLTACVTFSVSACQALAGDLSNKDSARPDALTLPKPSDIQAFEIHPTKIALRGLDDAKQIIITATLNDKHLQDLSGDVKYAVADQKIVRVT